MLNNLGLLLGINFGYHLNYFHSPADDTHPNTNFPGHDDKYLTIIPRAQKVTRARGIIVSVKSN